jgi:prepilin-type N-terminal cleavage/methylation domain-containing protein
MRNKNGVTLIELIIVVSIIGILLVALGLEFVGWKGRSAVEVETRDLYNNLMNARVNAMNRNRDFFVTGATDYYVFFEDTSPWPNGDGVLQTATDQIVPELSAKNNFKAPALAFLTNVQDKIRYAYCLPAGYTLPLIINKKGLLAFLVAPAPPEPVGGVTIRIDPDGNCALPHDSPNQEKNPDYDCVNIQNETRIKMGKWNVNTNACDIK